MVTIKIALKIVLNLYKYSRVHTTTILITTKRNDLVGIT